MVVRRLRQPLVDVVEGGDRFVPQLAQRIDLTRELRIGGGELAEAVNITVRVTNACCGVGRSRPAARRNGR